MKAENKSYARTLNRRLQGWYDAGIESDLVKTTKSMLEMFYDRYSIETDERYFATNLELTPQAEAEYELIMDMYGNQAGSSINEMKRQYESVKEEFKTKYSVNTFEDYIKFTDAMKIGMAVHNLKDIISSEQLAELYSVASGKGISPEDVDYMLILEYQSSGKTYDALYNQILGAIETYDDSLQFGWK